jgi:GT2 family glycosyltransferase
MKPFLSVIILNYKSGSYLAKCLKSIYQSQIKNFDLEIIIVDNHSPDDSIILAQKQKSNIKTKYILLKTNQGFAHGNNQGVKQINASSTHILFLNPDTTVEKNTFQKMMDFFDKNPQVDAATCKIILVKTGQIQPECHRGFPYPWRTFCYFTNLYKLAPKSAFFNGYFLGQLDLEQTHPIECCVGAFIMMKKEVGQAINWWNEKYFFYGEDLDMCYKLKENNFNLYYYPHCTINHYQGISSGIIKHSQKITQASKQTKITVAKASTNAMRIFYQENLLKNYNIFTKYLILFGIKILEIYRITKARYL